MWIESNCDLADHPKTLDLMGHLETDVDKALGKLHRFWYWVLKYAENGDLRKFSKDQIGRAVDLPGEKFVSAMIQSKWIDTVPYLRVHDWWDYIGIFLTIKYKQSPEKWQAIKILYKDNNSSNNSSNNGFVNRQPNLTKPNLTKPYITDERFEQLWKEYPKKLGKDKALLKAQKQILNEKDFDNCLKAIKNYVVSIKGKDQQYTQHGSTFFNLNWKDYVDYPAKPEVKSGNNWR